MVPTGELGLNIIPPSSEIDSGKIYYEQLFGFMRSDGTGQCKPEFIHKRDNKSRKLEGGRESCYTVFDRPSACDPSQQGHKRRHGKDPGDSAQRPMGERIRVMVLF